MDPMTIIAILEALVKFVSDVPEMVTAVETAIGLLQPGAAAPTADQQAAIDSGLAAANNALQAS